MARAQLVRARAIMAERGPRRNLSVRFDTRVSLSARPNRGSRPLSIADESTGPRIDLAQGMG